VSNILTVDCETLCLRPTAVVTQAAFVVGNLETGQILHSKQFSFNVAIQKNSSISHETLEFWFKQDPSVITLSFNRVLNRLASPEFAFEEIKFLMETYGAEIAWAYPSAFDFPILTHLFDSKKPWKFYNERCALTILNQFKSKIELPEERRNKHDAYADAAWLFQCLHILNKVETLV